MPIPMIPISVWVGSRCSTTICLAVAKSRTSTTVCAEWRQSIFTNSTPTTRDKACDRKVVKKSGVHIQYGSTGCCIDQPKTGQCDHNQDHNGQNDLSITGYIVDQLIEMLADPVINGSSVVHIAFLSGAMVVQELRNLCEAGHFL